ncbi:hypothetical protein OLMES_3688 [Oleiphilus messinensis]|uniref:Uncharacterized protein n=1 Tax=Oleiphilus messinensis TaxID=141451 RepID=A0A1Y0IC24_9GAMM|nr:hypothetical protein [Oleiphilus messinensis]ARU57709.1 hypothetical protein OLMES_3688 [Oleiphilus messinensis]
MKDKDKLNSTPLKNGSVSSESHEKRPFEAPKVERLDISETFGKVSSTLPAEGMGGTATNAPS